MSKDVVTGPDAWRLGAVLLVCGLPAVLAPGTIGSAAALATSTAPGREYLAAGHIGLVYGLVPVVALSATVLLLAPGLLVAMLLGRSRSVTEWIFSGFVISVVVVSVVSGIAQAGVGSALRGTVYGVMLLALAAGLAIVLARRAERAPMPWPFALPDSRRDLVALLALWVAAYVLLAPKLLWESFNGDGAHAFESSRLLLRHALPFWPTEAGSVAGFPGVTSMLFAFPNAWFLRLFGEVEFAVRVPLLLYVPVLLCGLRELASVGLRPARLSPVTGAALLLTAVAYVLAMAFSATYNPYSADIALPATQDTLLMIAYVGALAASLRGDRGWLFLCMGLTYVSLPSGLILLGFWLVARVLSARPVPWREVTTMAAMLVALFVGAALVPRVLVALGGAPPGGEYGLVGILRYFAFLQFTDLSRLLYVAIPAGLFPVLVAAHVRAQDREQRALALVTLAYFLFFFVQAHVSLHHFVPAMVLPIAIALRQALSAGDARRPAVAWASLAAVAVLLAWPWGRFGVHRQGRDVGAAVTVRIPGYAESSAEVMRASTLLDRIFPYDWSPSVPSQYGGSPLVWNRYARHADDADPSANYIVQRASDAAPTGWRLAGSDSTGAAVFVRSDSVWARHRALQPPTPPGSSLLAVPRGILFHSVPLQGGPRIIDVAATLEALGLDVDPLLQRLGARRGS